MKFNILKVLCFLLFGSMGISQGTNLALNIPQLVEASNTPATNNRISYTVSELQPSCVDVYGSNPGQMAINMGDGTTVMNFDQTSTVLAMAKLFSVSGTTDQKSFNFGGGCGEDGVDDANVKVFYQNGVPSRSSNFGDANTIGFPITNQQILVVENNNTIAGPTGDKMCLRVNASNSNMATISIDANPKQGQVYVCLFSAEGTPNAIAMLHSKSTDLSFTVNQDVYVVPLIKPTMDNTGTTMFFDVGDPKRNAKVKAAEEGE